MISSMNQYINYIESNFANRIAFQWYDEEKKQVQSKTYAEYAGDVRKFAAYVEASIPDAEGKHIGMLAYKSYHSVVGIMGIMLAGAVLVPLNTEETLENIQYQIEFAEIKHIFHDGMYLEQEPDLKRCAATFYMVDRYEDVVNSVVLKEHMDPDRLLMLIFTSGTTDRSKGVMLSQKNVFSTLNSFRGNMSPFKFLSILPLYHVGGLATLFFYLVGGSTLGLCSELKYMFRDLKLLESTTVGVVPLILDNWTKLLKRGGRSRLGKLDTINVSTAPVDSSVFELYRKNGINVMQSYGMTESFGGGTQNMSTDIQKIASVGTPYTGVEIKMVDGEICLKSDGIMLGYYKDPEATAQVIQEGWLHTGDLGYLDEDGFLYLTGRKKNLIILSSGENVSPEELESLLLKNAAVKEVVVREKSGKIGAEILCDKADQEMIRQFVAEVNRTLPLYKRMTLLEFRGEPFPRTTNGKIKRI